MRKPGTPNKTTVDLREIRRRIADSWDRCNGDQLLEDIAEKDPATYLRLVVGILPRETEISIEPFVEAGVHTTRIGQSFLSELERTAGATPVTPSVVLAVLQRGNGNGRGLTSATKAADVYDDGEGI